MKYIVTSYMRTGSTLVTEVIAKLTGKKWEYVDMRHLDGNCLNTENVEKIKAAGDVVKVHGASALDLLLSLPDHIVVCVKRNFKDTLVSRILYERHNRYEKGQNCSKPIERLVSIYPLINDAALCNLYVETQEEEIKREFLLWQKYSHIVVSPRVVTVDYDYFANEPNQLMSRLVPVVESTEDRQREAMGCFSRKYMEAKHGKSFLSFGQPGQHRILLDQDSIQSIDRITKKIKYNQ